MEVTEVKGIGPATAIKLKTAGIDSAEDLISKSIDELIEAGIRKGTATKILANAQELLQGAPSEKVKPKKAKKAKKKKKAEPKKSVVEGLALNNIKGIGPKTRKLLEEAGISSAEMLVDADLIKITELGITKVTVNKIIKNAFEALGREIPKDAEPTPEAAKKAPMKKAKKKAKFSEEHQRSPMPQGIPTRKKRGVQIRGTATEDAVETSESVVKSEGWGVQAKELSKEQIERRKRRQEELARRRTITRKIPQQPVPIKAVKTKKGKKSPAKPVKVEKTSKKLSFKEKQQKVKIETYTQKDLFGQGSKPRRRGVSAKQGEKKSRIDLERNTYLGKISSHRRSKRVIHERQVILQLEDDFNSDQIVGQKVYFTYPDNEKRVAGSISKRFGKSSSKKVLINFKKGIRLEGIHQKVFIK